MKRVIKYLILFALILIPIGVHAEDDFGSLTKKMTKPEAIDACVTGDSDSYHCYRYTFTPTIGRSTMYNTTVWTSKTMGCGFELTDWDYNSCKSAALDITYEQCKDNYCRNISHSGYNGTPDFYDKRVSKDRDIECDNLSAFHIIYRAITIIAPIITILFVTFDLVASIISGDAKKVSKFRSKLLRRVIALLVLIVLPIGVHLLVNTLSKNNVIKDSKMLKCVVLGYNDTDTTKPDPNSTLQPKELEKPNLITSVKVDGTEISGFSTETKTYTMTVPNTKSSITIDASLTSENAQIISGTGNQELKEGSNTIKIIATTDNINYDTITLKVTREKKAEETKTVTTKTPSTTKTTTKNISTKSYGTTKGTEVMKYQGINYIVVKTKHPDGLKKQISNFKEQKIRQNANQNAWGSCCNGMARIQACGIYKSKNLTLKSTKLSNSMKKSCEGVYSGCNFGKTVRPNSEKEFVDYVIGKIQEGKPVVIRVVSKKCAKTKKQCGRHFVTVIGFKQNSTGSWKDFLIVDSWDALIERMDTNNRAVVPYKKTIPVDRDPSKPNQYMATPVK